MFLNHKKTVFAFVLPLVFLIGMSGMNEYYLRTSKTVMFPVEGYDPRDLIAGYYLRYKVNYGLKCPDSKNKKDSDLIAYICVQPERKITLFRPPENCSFFIKGRCGSKGKFHSSSVDRYYIPENKAKTLEKLFMSAKEKQVVLSVTKKGRALVKDILIDGKSVQSLF